MVADRAQIDAAAAGKLLTQPGQGLIPLGLDRGHAGQLDGVAAIAVAHLQEARTAHLQHLGRRGRARHKTEHGQRQHERQQTGRSEGTEARQGAQSLAPQLGQKKWALAVVAPQELHCRWVSIASSGWLGRPTIWALLAPGGTIG